MTTSLLRLAAALAIAAGFSSCLHHHARYLRKPPAQEEVLATQTGKASYYGGRFHGKKTASGEIYDKHSMTAAHRTHPFGTRVRVTNLNNGHQVILRINNRGPFIEGRIIDVSRAAAEQLGMIQAGVVPARVEVLNWGDEG